MAMNLDAMLRIKADVDGQNKIVSLNRGLQQVGTTAAGVTGAMRGLTGAAAGLSGALGTLAPLLSAAGLVGMVKNTIEAGNVMYDLSQATGVSVEALARFKKAAVTSGTSLEGVSKGLVKLNKAMLDAATGGKASVATFQALGINVKNTDGTLKSADRVMLEVANRFKEMPDGAVKTALALRLFGKSGAELIPMLNMGGDAIDKLKVKMTEAFAQRADEYSDKLAMLSGKVGALGADLTIALLPALEGITNALTVAVTAFNELPAPLKSAAVGAATLAIAWGPLTGALKGGIGLLASAANGLEILRYQTALAGGVMPLLTGGIEGLSAAILAIPGWGWALAGVAALGLLSKALYDSNDTFRAWADNIGTVVAEDFTAAMTVLASSAKAGTDQAAVYFNTLGTYINDWCTWLDQRFEEAFTKLGDYAKSGSDTIAAKFNELGKYFDQLGTWISDKFKWAFGSTSQSAQVAAKKSESGWATAWSNMASSVASSLASTAKMIQDWWNSIPAPIRGFLSGSAQGPGVFKDAASLAKWVQSANSRAVAMGKQQKVNRADKTDLPPLPSGFTPDLGALESGGGSGAAKKAKDAADEAKKIKDGLEASKAKLDQAKAELAILRESDPIKKIQLEYEERRRVVIAEAAQELSKALSVEETANIQRTRAIDLQKLGVQETNALKDAYKELGDAAYEAALKTAEWGSSVENANNAMTGLRDGISSYLESAGTLASNISTLTVDTFKGLEDAIVSLTTTGTYDFKQFAASMIEEMTRMVTQLLILAPLLQWIQSLLPGGSILSGTNALSTTKLVPGGIFANGGAFANGIQPFAAGGVINSPTLFKFANGGAMNTGLMGEAGPEAIMPLKRGKDGKLGVAGASGSTSVVVNVDAKGSSVQGDSNQSEALGRAISSAVQAELVKQKRPGGLLAA